MHNYHKASGKSRAKKGHAHTGFSRVDPRSTKGVLIPPLFMPSILLLLKEEPIHGYALLKRLSDLGMVSPEMDPSPIYKILRWFEAIGLAVSQRERGERGPDRKVYHITQEGEEALATSAERIESAAGVITWFQRRNEELK